MRKRSLGGSGRDEVYTLGVMLGCSLRETVH